LLEAVTNPFDDALDVAMSVWEWEGSTYRMLQGFKGGRAKVFRPTPMLDRGSDVRAVLTVKLKRLETVLRMGPPNG